MTEPSQPDQPDQPDRPDRPDLPDQPSQATGPRPGSGERHVTTVTNDGLTFDVLDAGPRDGEVVVLLHGFPERATCWRDVTPRLNAAGYRTLALDQRGYAPGARPTRRRDYKLPLLAGDVVALIDEAVGPDGTVHLVGHDWGAAAAWTTAALHPSRVRTLTAVSVPHPHAFMKAALHSSQLVKSWYMFLFQLPVLPEAMTRAGVTDRVLRGTGMSRDSIARFRAEVVDDGALRTALHWYRALPLTDPRTGGGAVAAPTTMIWSDGDTAIARWGVEHAARYIDADFRLVELPGVSHWIPTEAPDACADAVLDRIRG